MRVAKQTKKQIYKNLEEINWEITPIKVKTHNPDGVQVGFFQSKKSDPKVNQVRLRIGKNVLAQLDWKAGDKIVVYYDPKDLMSQKLVKTEMGTGLKLQVDTAIHNCRMQYTWIHICPLSFLPIQEIKFHIYKKQLLINLRLENSEDSNA